MDSGALTMLGAVIHNFSEPGEYRGSVRKDDEVQAVFYISVDKSCPVAQVNIDLAALAETARPGSETACGRDGSENRFSVNPRGYAVFRVSGGPGGFNVHVRRAVEDERAKIFDSRKLSEGTIFSSMILRPGIYSVVNLLGKARAEVVVSYPPKPGKTPGRPPAPVRVQATEYEFKPARIELMPTQGMLFECKSPARIKIELERPDDGPSYDPESD
jgi:hypothetical protein